MGCWHPPDALRDLREWNASTEQVNQILPRWPVKAIDIRVFPEIHQDWFGEEIAQHIARVLKLRI